MKRIEFLIWAGKHGWKHGQRYLQKAYNHFYDKGKIPDPKVILQKAKNYYDDFIGFTPKVVPKKEVVNIGDRIVKQMQKQGQTVTFDDLARIYGKKPPNLKADGGRIDKALPGRSRDI